MRSTLLRMPSLASKVCALYAIVEFFIFIVKLSIMMLLDRISVDRSTPYFMQDIVYVRQIQ